MLEIYACLLHVTGTQDEFDQRIPRLMAWLRELYASDNLVACGGGGWQNDTSGGLTLIRAETPEEAERLAAGNPMNEIGYTELMLWDCFYGNLDHKANEAKLQG